MSSGIHLLEELSTADFYDPKIAENLKALNSLLNGNEGRILVGAASFTPLFTKFFFAFMASDENFDGISNPASSIVNTVLVQSAMSPPSRDRFFEDHAFDIFKAVLFRSKFKGQQETSLLPFLLHKAYMHANQTHRSMMKSLIASVLSRARGSQYVLEEQHRINLCLQLSGFILKGASRPISPGHQVFIRKILLPIHEVTSSVTERRQALEVIHKYLIFAELAYLEKAPEEFTFILSAVLEFWPKSWAGTTAKELLFLNELESLLEVAPAEMFSSSAKGVFQQLREQIGEKVLFYISSEHNVLCQKALLFWQNGRIFDLFVSCEAWLLPKVLPVLLLKCLSHWNPSVQKKAALILKQYSTESDQHPSFQDIAARALKLEEPLESYFERIFEEHGLGAKQLLVDEEQDAGADAAIVPEKLLDLSVMNIVIDNEIGHGSFGVVHSAYKVVMGKTRSQWPMYAVKEIDKEHEKVAYREIESMDLVSHPNCVSMVGYYVTSKSINLVLEYAQKGDLHSLLVAFVRLEMVNVRFMSGEIAAALSAFHAKDFVFGDLKPENVLVFSNNHVKLCDFGAVRKVEEVREGAPLEGTFIYLSPELTEGKGGGIESDFWSFGCLFYQMMFGHPPFKVEDERLLPINRKHVFLAGRAGHEVIPMKSNTSEVDKLRAQAVELLQHLFVKEPSHRANLAVCEQHSFYQGLGVKSFEELCGQKAPELKEPTKKVKEQSQVNSAWTQRAYSMMVAPIPKKHAFESEEKSTLKMIPENPGDEKTQWKVNASFGSVDLLKVDPASITLSEGVVATKGGSTKAKLTAMGMRQRALNNASLGTGGGRRMPQLNMTAMLNHHGIQRGMVAQGNRNVQKPQVRQLGKGKKGKKGA